MAAEVDGEAGVDLGTVAEKPATPAADHERTRTATAENFMVMCV